MAHPVPQGALIIPDISDRIPSELDRKPEGPTVVRASTKSRRIIHQACVLVRRYASIWRGDRLALLALLGQSVLVALLLSLAFGRLGEESEPFQRVSKTINLFFLQAVTCFWFGCNTAAKELVKERVIYLRERDFNLRVSSYFSSKFIVLTLIVVTQTTLLFGIVRALCRPPGPLALEWMTLASMAVAGTSVGLLISALAHSEEVATALVPIAVVPQIVLAGVVTSLTGFARFLAKALITVYWGQQAQEHLLPDGDLMSVGHETGSWLWPWIIVLVHAIVGAAAAIGVLQRHRGSITGKTRLNSGSRPLRKTKEIVTPAQRRPHGSMNSVGYLPMPIALLLPLLRLDPRQRFGAFPGRGLT